MYTIGLKTNLQSIIEQSHQNILYNKIFVNQKEEILIYLEPKHMSLMTQTYKWYVRHKIVLTGIKYI